MPYDKTQGIILASGAVSIFDLQHALGTTSRDLGDLCSDRKIGGYANVVSTADGAKKAVLTKDGKQVVYGSHAPQARINKWAKHRSFSYPAWSFTSTAERDDKMAKQNYGFTLSAIPTSRNVVNFYTNEMYKAEWPVRYPMGGAMSPSRALDFQGYMTTWKMKELVSLNDGDNYIFPIPGASCYVDAPNKQCGGYDVVHFDMVEIDSTYDDYLITLDKLSEMLIGQGSKPLAEWYIGFALIGTTINDIHFCYTDITPRSVVGQGAIYVTSREFENMRGQYSVAPILVSDLPYGMVFTDHTAPWMNLSGHWPMDENSNALDVITIDGKRIENVDINPSYQSFNVSINAINIGGSSVTISGRISNTTPNAVVLTELMGYLVSEYINDYRVYDLDLIRDAIDTYITSGSHANVINEEQKLIGRYVNFMDATFSSGKSGNRVTIPSRGKVAFSLTISDMGDGYAGTIEAAPSWGLYSPASLVFGGMQKDNTRIRWEYE